MLWHTLKSLCNIEHGLDGFTGGENLASYTGASSASINNIMTRFTENEFASIEARGDKSLDKSEVHFTQVVWRATTRFGCVSEIASDGKCHIQVCRYRVTGNCNICTDTFCPNTPEGAPWIIPYDHWTSKTFADTSGCP